MYRFLRNVKPGRISLPGYFYSAGMSVHICYVNHPTMNGRAHSLSPTGSRSVFEAPFRYKPGGLTPGGPMFCMDKFKSPSQVILWSNSQGGESFAG